MNKELLDKVYNKKTNQEVCPQYCGRCVTNVSFNIGEPLKITFEEGGSISHENIIEVSEDDYGYWIETTKKLWKFDYVY